MTVSSLGTVQDGTVASPKAQCKAGQPADSSPGLLTVRLSGVQNPVPNSLCDFRYDLTSLSLMFPINGNNSIFPLEL